MAADRPAVFIGSSTEGLDIAKAIRVHLDRACEVTLWIDGVFRPSEFTLESLLKVLDTFDFGVLVATGDDFVSGREGPSRCPRDNVVLEIGLFLGKLGRERTFLVCDRTAELKLPSDLAGLTPVTFEPHKTGNVQSTVGAACTQLVNAIRQIGTRPGKQGLSEGGNDERVDVRTGLFQNVESKMFRLYVDVVNVGQRPNGTAVRSFCSHGARRVRSHAAVLFQTGGRG